MTGAKACDQFSNEETARRRDALAKHMLSTPPKPLKEAAPKSDKKQTPKQAARPSYGLGGYEDVIRNARSLGMLPAIPVYLIPPTRRRNSVLEKHFLDVPAFPSHPAEVLRSFSERPQIE